MQYEVEIARFAKITVETDNAKDAEDQVAVMDDDEIQEVAKEDGNGWIIWQAVEKR